MILHDHRISKSTLLNKIKSSVHFCRNQKYFLKKQNKKNVTSNLLLGDCSCNHFCYGDERGSKTSTCFGSSSFSTTSSQQEISKNFFPINSFFHSSTYHHCPISSHCSYWHANGAYRESSTLLECIRPNTHPNEHGFEQHFHRDHSD